MQRIARIVLIDDDEDLCALLKMELEAAGRFQVIVNTQSTTAMAMIKKERPDLAIIDINMPHIPGVDLAVKLSQEPETAGIPFLYLTGMIGPADVTHFIGSHNLQTLVSKQSPIADLIAAIDRLLPFSTTMESNLA